MARAHGTIALSKAVFDEVFEVLSSPKFASVLTEDRRRKSLSCWQRLPSGFIRTKRLRTVVTPKTTAIWNWHSPPRLSRLYPEMRICWYWIHGAAFEC